MWKRSKHLIDENAVENFEIQNKISIPLSLKSLIKECNGARPTSNTVEFDNTTYRLGWLLSYNEEDVYAIYKVYDYFKSKYNKKLLPFATEESGDYYCVDLDDKAVIYWSHEDEMIKMICDNISEFLSLFS